MSAARHFKVDALKLIDDADNRADEQDFDLATIRATQAIAAAILYAAEQTAALAEQQRIANLLTILPRLDDVESSDPFDWDRPLPTERSKALDTIREGLGLS